MSGPCLTDAAPETAPGGLFVGRKPLCGGPNVNLSGRCGSLRRWCHFHLSIRTCHDVSHRHPGRQNQCLADNKACQPYHSRHSALFWRVLAAGAHRGPPELGAVAAPSSGARFLRLPVGVEILPGCRSAPRAFVSVSDLRR
jgi:hypothetical protein